MITTPTIRAKRVMVGAVTNSYGTTKARRSGCYSLRGIFAGVAAWYHGNVALNCAGSWCGATCAAEFGGLCGFRRCGFREFWRLRGFCERRDSRKRRVLAVLRMRKFCESATGGILPAVGVPARPAKFSSFCEFRTFAEYVGKFSAPRFTTAHIYSIMKTQ